MVKRKNIFTNILKKYVLERILNRKRYCDKILDWNFKSIDYLALRITQMMGNDGW